MPKFDPIASLGIWAVEVELAGRVLRIPPLPAGDWLAVLMRLDLMGLLTMADEADVDAMLLDGEITYDELQDALTLLIEAAAGRSAWATFTLAHLAAENWHVVGGELARRGVRLDLLPLGAALDAIYGTLAQGMNDKGLKQLNLALDRAPVEIAPPRRAAAPLPANAEQYVRVRPRTVQRRPQDRQPAPSESPTPPLEPPADSGPADTSAPPPGAAADHPAE